MCARVARPPARPTAAGREAPPAVISAFTVGLAALELGIFESARDALGRLVALAPREPAGHALLGLVELRAGRGDRARAHLDKARRLAPASAAIAAIEAALAMREGDASAARAALERATALDPHDPRLWFALAAEREREADDAGALAGARAALARARALRPASLALPLEAARLAAIAGDGAALAVDLAALAAAESASPWPESPRARLAEARAAPLADAPLRLARLRNALQPLPRFQDELDDLDALRRAAGVPLYAPLSLTWPAPAPDPPDLALALDPEPIAGAPAGATWVEPLWTDARAEAAPSALVRGADGMVWAAPVAPGQPAARRIGPGAASAVCAVDVDHDGRLDLVVAGPLGLSLWRAREASDEASASFVEDPSAFAATGRAAAFERVYALDLDLDGDLDLIAGPARGAPRVLRNRGDGSFGRVEPSPFAGVSAVKDLAWADLDAEGTPDVVLLDDEGRVHRFRSLREGRFERVSSRGAPVVPERALALAVADLRATGRFALLALGESGAVWELTLPAAAPSAGAPSERGPRPRVIAAATLPGLAACAPGEARLLVGDLDLNGALDLVIAGPTAAEVWLGDAQGALVPWRDVGGGSGDGRIEGRVDALATADGSGRLALWGALPGGAPARWITRGARGYGWQAVRPRARALEGDGRVNALGLGGVVELRAGTLLARQPISSPVVAFGLGARAQADVLRVVWPNGTWQAELEVARERTITAEQRLKGSCPFLFAWDGEAMRFVTDLLWRSPLGLRINAVDTAGVVQTEDRVRVPPEALAPTADGRYELRVTAELWETHFFDHVALLAYDHPVGTEAWIDERFAIPPPSLEPRFFEPSQPFARVLGDQGQDVSAVVRRVDGERLDDFALGPVQGIAARHAVTFEVPDDAPRDRPLWLVAQGWVQPTDSSLNVALGQGTRGAPEGLALEVATQDGGFALAREGLGFPAGKEKTALVRLDDAFLAGAPRRARLVTNLEVYWDRLAWAAEVPSGARADVRERRLAPLEAVLRPRGYSVLQRTSRRAPELPDYDRLAGTAPRWLDLEGFHTRFGDVGALLAQVDDRYAILNAGDELALSFPALPPPGAGRTRTFALVAVGWVKDGDFHTRFGRTVEPLPSQDVPDYAAGDAPAVPLADDPVYRRHAADWERYHTRYVRPAPFLRGLRGATTPRARDQGR